MRTRTQKDIDDVKLSIGTVAALTPEEMADYLGKVAETLETEQEQKRREKLKRQNNLAEDLSKAYSKNTQRIWRSNWKVWCEFTQNLPAPSFPTNVATIRLFIESRIKAGRKRATIEQYLYTLDLVHKLADLPNPLDSFQGQLVVRAMRHNTMLPKAQRQAKPVTQKKIETIISHMDLDTPIGIRDRVLLLVAYETLFRRSELVGLNVEDIEARDEDDGIGAALYLPRSKTDQEGEGQKRPISVFTYQCLQQWLDIAGIEKGAVFRTIPPNWKPDSAPFVNRMDGNDVPKIFKRRAKRAGLAWKRISAHSTRVGAANDLFADGANTLAIMKAGGWQSERMVLRYTQDADLKNNAVQQRLRRTGWGAS